MTNRKKPTPELTPNRLDDWNPDEWGNQSVQGYSDEKFYSHNFSISENRDGAPIVEASRKRWQCDDYKHRLKHKIQKKKDLHTYRQNQRQKHLTGSDYVIVCPDGSEIKGVSANQVLLAVGVEITKQTGGKGYYYFRNGDQGYKPTTGRWKGYEFYKRGGNQ